MERTCPKCGSSKTVKNGQANGHPKRKRKDCAYQYLKDTFCGTILQLSHRRSVALTYWT